MCRYLLHAPRAYNNDYNNGIITIKNRKLDQVSSFALPPYRHPYFTRVFGLRGVSIILAKNFANAISKIRIGDESSLDASQNVVR